METFAKNNKRTRITKISEDQSNPCHQRSKKSTSPDVQYAGLFHPAAHRLAQ